jgi:hypothetical protein
MQQPGHGREHRGAHASVLYVSNFLGFDRNDWCGGTDKE